MLTWHRTCNEIAVTGLGHQALLDVPMTAFLLPVSAQAQPYAQRPNGHCSKPKPVKW